MNDTDNSSRGRGHGPIRETTIEVYDNIIEAEQCEACRLKVPISGAGSDGFETHSCELVQRYSAPKLITKEERKVRQQDTGNSHQ